MNQGEIVKAYVAADLLVLPSDSGETWGLVVNEALACSVPAVVSDLCGSAEDLVAPLDPRLVFHFGDMADLAAAIRHAMLVRPAKSQVQQIADTHHLRHTVATVTRLYAGTKNCTAVDV
jgi:glycosyltransferase involved in cell wall biosynthesis